MIDIVIEDRRFVVSSPNELGWSGSYYLQVWCNICGADCRCEVRVETDGWVERVTEATLLTLEEAVAWVLRLSESDVVCCCVEEVDIAAWETAGLVVKAGP